MEIWNKKLNLIKNYSKDELEKYESFQIKFKKEYFKLNKIFNNEIYIPKDIYSQEEIYSIMENMRE